MYSRLEYNIYIYIFKHWYDSKLLSLTNKLVSGLLYILNNVKFLRLSYRLSKRTSVNENTSKLIT